MNKYTILTGGLLTITAVAGGSLVCVSASADVVDDINITVPVSCSLSGTNLSQTSDIRNGIYTDDIGSANIKATCTDTAGFDIYAIGYTDDTYGNNKMHDSTLSTDYDIPTGKYTQGTTTESVWSMKLIPATGTYTPIIRDDSTYDYTDYEVVPAEYTKVAYREAGTDYGEGSIGANFATKYAVYADIEQPAGEYTGQVKFTLVHPNEAPAPTPPGPEPSSTCTTPVPGAIYMQDLNDSNTATIMNNMTENAQYYLRDSRDKEPYCVSKIQGAIWMTQNLRITGVVPSEGSNFTGSDYDVSAYDLKADGAEGGACYFYGDSGDELSNFKNACSHTPDASDLSASGLTAEQIGVWYNYASATAGQISGTSDMTSATQDICPAGWSLPSYDANTSSGSINSLVGLAPTALDAFSPVTGGFYKRALLSSADALGFWWSATHRGFGNYYAYYYDTSSLNIHDSIFNRNMGFFIRCVRTVTL